MSSASFTRLATIQASTRRNVSQSGAAPLPTQVIASLMIMPFSVLDAQTRARVVVEAPHQLSQTFAQSDTPLDTKNGDYLVVAGVEYPIRDVGRSPWLGGYRYQFVIEDLGN